MDPAPRSLGESIARFVREQRLGFVATVSRDGSPNLSPKGSVRIRGDDLVFADIRSPSTVRNLRHNPAIEINVVDVISRRGYRFKGRGRVVSAGAEFDILLDFLRAEGVESPVRSIVVVELEHVGEVTSPSYDSGRSERDIREHWRGYWQQLDSSRPNTDES